MGVLLKDIRNTPMLWLLVFVPAVFVFDGQEGLQAVADLQLRRFATDPANRGKTVDVGLWRWSRHPNYLGEITLWWGLWLFGLAAAPNWWWTIIGPLAMVGLFLWISIPLMERRSLERCSAAVKRQPLGHGVGEHPRIEFIERCRETPKVLLIIGGCDIGVCRGARKPLQSGGECTDENVPNLVSGKDGEQQLRIKR